MIDSGQKNDSNKKLLAQYASLGVQLVAALIIAVFLGKWIDEKIKFNFPVLIWLFPLLVIIGMILKAVKDTSRKNE